MSIHECLLHSCSFGSVSHSLHCIAIVIMAAEEPRILLDGARLQEYMDLYGVAPFGRFTQEYCVQRVEEYVQTMTYRRFFTENVAFNIVRDGRLLLVVCLSSATSTSIRNEQLRLVYRHGVFGIGDVYMWIQIGSWIVKYRFLDFVWIGFMQF